LSPKVPEPQTQSRLFTIPPSAPFLSTLARAILSGDLPNPGGDAPDRLVLPNTTIYLPTRRAARALREAFLAESGGEALLLPHIRALGEADEDAALILDAGLFDDADGAAVAPAMGPVSRLIALMRLILKWRHTATETEIDFLSFGITPGQAVRLARDLANLMDAVESEEVDFSRLGHMVPEDFATHWAATIDFLSIVTKHWPDYLAEAGVVSPVGHRNLLMQQETERLKHRSTGPVIAAGSTGTVPATARLLETIVRLPNGAVVLPGLDFTLDDESWAQLPDHPEHPQAGMADLLKKLGVARREVQFVPASAPNGAARARLHLASEALRPAETTEQWERYLTNDALSPEGRASFANALTGLSLVEAPTAHDEAEAIALILRGSIVEPGRTAALVTPDRALARRVAVRLKGYGLAIDDSAGLPVARTIPGAFLDLLLSVVESDFAPPEIMALLKHPLVRLGRAPATIRGLVRMLERTLFRDIYLGRGLAGVAWALQKAKSRVPEDDHAALSSLVQDLQQAFAPLAALFASKSDYSTSALAEAQAAAAEALARDEEGKTIVWRGDAGEVLSLLLSRLIEEGSELAIPALAYPAFYRNILSGAAVRPRGPAHPRLFIWGPLEARLQQPDLVIIGSLNEGTWPRPPETGPWLSRPMRAKLGLSPPERRIGLSAHDFAQALGAKTVVLTRALRVDGVETVASRWLQRLQALVEASGLAAKLSSQLPWVAWARERDAVTTFSPCAPPSPRPPVAARPSSLSVTQIERWIANPYEIYAKHILKLEPLKPLGTEPDAAMRGTVFHRILNDFAEQYPESLPTDIYAALLEIANPAFEALGDAPSIRGFWQPSFERFAQWFAATEPQRRARVARTHAELTGTLPIGETFELKARADRIDVGKDGRVTIYDYKTGVPPKKTHVEDLYAPQLPLEAAIATAGGFPDLGARRVADLFYIQANGRQDGGEQHEASKESPETLAAKAKEDLEKLVAHFRDPQTPYDVKRRCGRAFANYYRHDDYAQLARLQEWLTQQDVEEDCR
jgi:double-strand break repair protein AddB